MVTLWSPLLEYAMPPSLSKLTKRTVDGAAPRPGRYFVWDTELRGFGLRVAESGTKTYIVRYRPRGIGRGAPKRFVVLGRHGPITPDEARSKAKALLGAVASGQDPAKDQTRSVEAVTVAALVDLFIEEHVKPKRKARTAGDYAAVLKGHLVPHLGKRLAERISAFDIGNLHLALRDRPYQANRMLAIIASMYSFAVKRGLLPKGTNPVEGVERYRESSRERYLTIEELNRLGETLRLAETTGLPWKSSADKPASKHLAKPDKRHTLLAPEVVLAFRLLLFTGARLREILHLQWRHVDLDRGLILLPDSKTGRKTIVMSTLVLALLRASKRTGAFVIAGAGNDKPRSRSQEALAGCSASRRAGRREASRSSSHLRLDRSRSQPRPAYRWQAARPLAAGNHRSLRSPRCRSPTPCDKPNRRSSRRRTCRAGQSDTARRKREPVAPLARSP